MPDSPATLAQSRVVGGKLSETDEETFETIDAADCSRALAGADPTLPQTDVGQFLRPVIGQSLDRDLGSPTTKAITLAHSEEIIPIGATTPPTFDAFLRACGTQREDVMRVAVTSPSGTFQRFETISDGVDKEGILIGVQRNAAGDTVTHLLYVLVGSSDDFADEDVIAGSISSAEAVADGSTEQVGYAYHPLSESTGVVPPSMTVTHFIGGKELTAICRGNAVFRFEESNPGVIDFSMVGPMKLSETGGWPENDPPADIPLISQAAPRCTLSELVLADGSTTYTPPVVPGMTVDLGQQITPRTTITRSVGATGLRPPRIRQRDIVVSLSPEDVPASDHDFWGNALNGTPARLSNDYGEIDGLGRVIFHADRVQYSAQLENRDNVVATSLTMAVRASARNDWPFFLAVLKEPE